LEHVQGLVVLCIKFWVKLFQVPLLWSHLGFRVCLLMSDLRTDGAGPLARLLSFQMCGIGSVLAPFHLKNPNNGRVSDCWGFAAVPPLGVKAYREGRSPPCHVGFGCWASPIWPVRLFCVQCKGGRQAWLAGVNPPPSPRHMGDGPVWGGRGILWGNQFLPFFFLAPAASASREGGNLAWVLWHRGEEKGPLRFLERGGGGT